MTGPGPSSHLVNRRPGLPIDQGNGRHVPRASRSQRTGGRPSVGSSRRASTPGLRDRLRCGGVGLRGADRPTVDPDRRPDVVVDRRIRVRVLGVHHRIQPLQLTSGHRPERGTGPRRSKRHAGRDHPGSGRTRRRCRHRLPLDHGAAAVVGGDGGGRTRVPSAVVRPPPSGRPRSLGLRAGRRGGGRGRLPAPDRSRHQKPARRAGPR